MCGCWSSPLAVVADKETRERDGRMTQTIQDHVSRSPFLSVRHISIPAHRRKNYRESSSNPISSFLLIALPFRSRWDTKLQFLPDIRQQFPGLTLQASSVLPLDLCFSIQLFSSETVNFPVSHGVHLQMSEFAKALGIEFCFTCDSQRMYSAKT
jgi:hypothetical protein